MSRAGIFFALSCALGLSGFSASAASMYPAGTVRIIAPFAQGGGVDILSRLLAENLTKLWGETVIVDNRPGATGAIGAKLVADAAPNGYTILLGNVGSQAINPAMNPKLPYTESHFIPITELAEVPEVLVVNPKLGVDSVKALIALAKKEPGKLNYGSAGIGSPPHLAALLFFKDAGIQAVHVPYTGSTPALTDLLGGAIEFYFANILSALPYAHAGTLRALAVTESRRSAVAPGLPTMAESGLPGYEASNWYGLLAPKGTPAAVVQKIYLDTKKVFADPSVSSALLHSGAEPVNSSPAQFGAYIHGQIALYKSILATK